MERRQRRSHFVLRLQTIGLAIDSAGTGQRTRCVFRQSAAFHRGLLNSGTEVANDWIDRMVTAAYAEPVIGTVTPFSNMRGRASSHPAPARTRAGSQAAAAPSGRAVRFHGARLLRDLSADPPGGRQRTLLRRTGRGGMQPLHRKEAAMAIRAHRRLEGQAGLAGVRCSGRYENRHLPQRLRTLDSHLIWFPT